MKKVLLVTPSLHHGGTNKVIENLLATKQNDEYALYVLAMDYCGVYKQAFDRYNLLKENAALGAFSPLNETQGLQKIKRIFWKIFFKVFFKSRRKAFFRLAAKKSRLKDYDIVVAFQEGLTTEFVAAVPAKKRIAWVHSDYNSYLNISGKKDESEIYNAFDKIVCVAKYTTDVFISKYPQFHDRAECIYNVMDFKGIIEKADMLLEDSLYTNDCFTLISIGRMDPVKRFDHIPTIAKKMVESGCQFKWYIMGGGGTQENEVRTAIQENGVEEQVVMLGERSNPYPYLKKADVLVCLSTSEACPNVINEAKILHVPVVSTNFPTAYEHIEQEITGIITTIETLADTLIKICRDKVYFKRLKESAAAFCYDNEQMEKQLAKLFLE